jgi:hypothetical protein
MSWFLLSVSLLFSALGFAQIVTGTLTGTVTDQQGAVVPGATVTITNRATGAVRTATTGDAGTYSLPETQPGTYTVKVTKAGFSDVIINAVDVHVSSVARADARLAVGTQKQEIEVQGAAVQLNTENGEVGNVMIGDQVRELPLNGRNFVQLTLLMPGASASENFDNKSKGLMGGVDISFSGAPETANQWLVDGANNNDMGSRRTILIFPSIDGIEEFKILRNSYGPEYGGGGGAQVNIVTKGGGNDFHGSAFYFGRNAALNAKNFFIGQNKCTTPGDPNCKKQSLQRNDYGFNFGGPIKKDRVFFFWSQEWNVERRGAVRHDWVPDARMRNGDFSELAAPGCQAAGAPALPNFPAGTTSAPGVLLPANVSPAGQLYASQAPLPTNGVCNPYDWTAQVKVPLNWREDSIRGDVNITKRNTVMLKFTNDAWTNPLHGSANGEAGLWGTQDFPGVSDAWQQPSKMAVARLTSTISSTMVNDFQFSWSANRINIARAGDTPDLASKITAAMPTVYPLSGKMHANQLPTAICWCSTYFGIQSPWANRQDLYTWKDDFSKVTGKHTFKFGVLYARNAKDEEQGDEAGGLWGAGGYKSVNWANTNNFYGDMMLKGMLWGANENDRNVIADIRWRDYEFYAGDTWKLRRTLTLDYGFRWTVMPPEYMEKNDFSSFQAYAYNPALGGDPCNGVVMPKGGDPTLCAALGSKIKPPISPWRGLKPTNNHLIAPRLGFAWDVFGTSKFVLRGGIGQFFSRDPVGLTLRTKSRTPPYSAAGGGYRALDGPLTPGVGIFDQGGAANPWPVGGTPGASYEQNTNISNSWQWNVTTEVLVAKDTKLELGWVALRGIHLENSADINQIKPADRLNYILTGINNPGAGRNNFFPFGADLGSNRLTQWQHRGDSIYHSLQAMFSTKLSHNSIVQANYTWSHNIATTTLTYGDTNEYIADTYNSKANRGNADFDRRHVFNVSIVYNLPTLAGRNAFVKGAAGGWEVGTIFSYAVGSAQTVGGLTVSNVCPSQAQLAACNAGTVALIGVGNPWGVNNQGEFGGRPMSTNAPCNLGHSFQWLNPAGFTANGFPLGGYPNNGIGQCPGPGVEDMDFSLNKNWQLPIQKGNRIFTEGVRMQLRIELFNAFNHPMFRFNGANESFSATGLQGSTVTGYIAPNNTIQGTVLSPGSHFGKPPLLSNLGNREIQYAVKFIF